MTWDRDQFAEAAGARNVEPAEIATDCRNSATTSSAVNFNLLIQAHVSVTQLQ